MQQHMSAAGKEVSAGAGLALGCIGGTSAAGVGQSQSAACTGAFLFSGRCAATDDKVSSVGVTHDMQYGHGSTCMGGGPMASAQLAVSRLLLPSHVLAVFLQAGNWG
jgi:hypothetical protein